MCVLFRCQSCEAHLVQHQREPQPNSTKESPQSTSSSISTTYVNYCGSVSLDQRDKGEPCSETSWHSEPQPKCIACSNVCGAIEQLSSLVYMYPWLELEGLSAMESMASWEKEGLVGLKRKIKRWDSLDEDVQMEKEVQEKFVKMGLKELDDERKGHQGFGKEVLRQSVQDGRCSQAAKCEDW